MTDLPDLPEHVRTAVAPRERKAPFERARADSSPYQPYDSVHYKLPKRDWAFIGLPTAFALAALFSAAPDLWTGLLVGAPFLVVLYRLPQEWSRRACRGWTCDEDLNTYRWFDRSGEWKYARWQAKLLPRVLRTLVSLVGVLILLVIANYEPVQFESYGDYAGIFWVLAVAIYTYRHLPTPFYRAESYRSCDACGMNRPAESVRICPKCGRVADVYHYAALPSLRRRWRDL
ncbi:hypothetical protein ACNKF0_09550 [Nocardioides sp. T5]|uniref:hypothetical protein n=1 Tax=Nocardioides sp. T5 TaxID=3400182 RepID=UPI003A87CEB5